MQKEAYNSLFPSRNFLIKHVIASLKNDIAFPKGEAGHSTPIGGLN